MIKIAKKLKFGELFLINILNIIFLRNKIKYIYKDKTTIRRLTPYIYKRSVIIKY